MTKSQFIVFRLLEERNALPFEPTHPGPEQAGIVTSNVFQALCLLARTTGFHFEAHVYNALQGLPFCITELALALGELQFTLDYFALDFGFRADTQERKLVLEWLRNESIIRRHKKPAHMENHRVEGHFVTLELHALALASALGATVDLFKHGPIPRRTLSELRNAFSAFQRTLDLAGTHCGLDLERIAATLHALKMKELPYTHADLLPAVSEFRTLA